MSVGPSDKEQNARVDYSRLSTAFSGLAKPAQRALIGNDILRPDDLAKWRRPDVAKLHGIGPAVLVKLGHILRAADLDFNR